jgi:hypothetical protein
MPKLIKVTGYIVDTSDDITKEEITEAVRVGTGFCSVSADMVNIRNWSENHYLNRADVSEDICEAFFDEAKAYENGGKRRQMQSRVFDIAYQIFKDNKLNISDRRNFDNLCKAVDSCMAEFDRLDLLYDKLDSEAQLKKFVEDTIIKVRRG